jgi:multicomponent Na+:H+ antiporter subunit D
MVPVAVPLLAAGLLIAAPHRRWLHRASAVAATVVVVMVSVVLIVDTMDNHVPTLNVGGWPAGFAIVFAADTFSALMLCVSSVLVLLGLAIAAGTGDDDSRFFKPLVLVMSTGVYGALLTADLFNLFVFIEVMLAPSYALLTMAGGRERIAASKIYVTVNLLASTIFLAGVALLYAVAGTVNLGELDGSATSTAAALAAVVVLLALTTKAAVVPFHGWLPRSYPHAPPSVTVLFSGLLTKVGVYAIIRTYAVLFDGTPRFRWVIMVAALLTMVVGVLGAVGETSVRGILSFHMVSQIGYIMLGLGLFTATGLAAAIFFMLQYVLVKAALFGCTAAVEMARGTGQLAKLGGLARQDPLLAATFMLAALSLAGVPPLSGFVAKLSLVTAAAAVGDYPAVAIAVAVSLLTLLSMLKIWSSAFWGEPAEHPATPQNGRANKREALVLPAFALALPSLLLGVGAQPLLAAADSAAAGLLNPSAYVQAVSR